MKINKLVLLFTFEYIYSWRIVTNDSHVCRIEGAGFFVGIVEACCCQIVRTPANHLPCISEVSFYCVCIHWSWVYFLAILDAEYLNSCDLAKQQWFYTKPSLICKKIKLWGTLFSQHPIMQNPTIQKPIQHFQKLQLSIECILWTMWSTSPIADINQAIPVCAKITNMTVHSFLMKVEYNIIILLSIWDHSSSRCW